jgi:uncharacterized protein
MNPAEPVQAQEKYSRLLSFLKGKDAAVIAFSGGVDSSFLLYAMKMAGMNVLAVTAESETMPENDLETARRFTEEIGITHVVIKTEELSNEDFVRNPPDRCFYCKDELFRRLREIAEQNGYRYVFDGSNADDLLDYRPGIRAAKLYAVRSPLVESGFTKDDIRLMSREMGLKAWNRPASPCLSSRIPYGQRISQSVLQRIQRAEELVRSFGIENVRVRDHGDTARIEVSERDMHIFFEPEKRRRLTSGLKSFGYVYVSLDLEGYQSGSMNKVLNRESAE